MNTLRLESGYRHWGHDITDEDTPIEAGLGFTIGWDKPNPYNGRTALEAERDQPRNKRLIKFRLEHPELLCYHDDPIFAERRPGGQHHVVDVELCRGPLPGHGLPAPPGSEGVVEDWLGTGRFEINVGGELVPATPSIRSFYDPRNQRVRLGDGP